MTDNKKLTKNTAQCNGCKDIIESKHRHDWVRCSCGKTFVDGGLDYARRGYDGTVGYTELSEYE